MQNELRNSKNFFKLIDLCPVCIFFTDTLGNCIYVNWYWTKISGMPTQAALNKGWLDAIYPEDREQVFNSWTSATQAEKALRLKFRFITPEKMITWVETEAVTIFDESKQFIGYSGTIKDITREYNLEKELRSAIHSAQTSALAKSRFLDIAAHELRTPVTGFSILLQLTQKRLIEGRAVELGTLNQLKKQVDRISRLVVDLLDVSRLERGLIRLKFETIDLASLINDCIEDTKLKYQIREFIYSRPNYLINATVDKIRIYQVVMNLLENANKYTAENLPVEIIIESLNEKVRVSVKDYGHGITLDQQEKLFTPLSRGSTELTEQSGGLGLGLYICREIVKLHGGVIGVESKINVGSTFYFELPSGLKI